MYLYNSIVYLSWNFNLRVFQLSSVQFLILSPAGCDSVATAIIDIKNSSSTYTQVAQCDSFTWALNGQTYFTSQIDTIQSINADSCLHIDSLDLMIYPK